MWVPYRPSPHRAPSTAGGGPADSPKEAEMNVQELLSQSRDAMTVKRVFGDPIERDGVTVIPVANVSGGAGGGSGGSADEQGSGGGFGLRATPAGVYVIRGDQVSWEPALNLNHVILGGQIVAIALILALRAFWRARSRR